MCKLHEKDYVDTTVFSKSERRAEFVVVCFVAWCLRLRLIENELNNAKMQDGADGCPHNDVVNGNYSCTVS